MAGRTLLPQNLSLVVVFAGNSATTISAELAEHAVGAKPLQTSALPGSGVAMAWGSGLQVFSRIQGPNRHRIELQQVELEDVHFAPLSTILIKLSQEFPKLEPVTTGINHVTTLLGTPPEIKKLMGMFTRKSMAPKLFGDEQQALFQVGVEHTFMEGLRKVTFLVGDLSGSSKGKMKGLMISFNYEFSTPNQARLKGVLSDQSLSSIEADIKRILQGVEEVS